MAQPTLLLLHGALGAADQLAPLADSLAADFDVRILEFPGHGGRAAAAGPFAMETFQDAVRDAIRQQGLAPARVFGYSMGGFAACRLALAEPELFAGLATLGTIFRWDEVVAAREAALLDVAAIRNKLPRFAARLAERHVALGWEALVERTRELLGDLGRAGGIEADEMAQLAPPLRIIVGDRDESVDLRHSQLLALAAPQGTLEVIPRAGHPLERVPLARLADSLRDCFKNPSMP
jgi:pimeloyl-ACP methyl ester carboxylesterase